MTNDQLFGIAGVLAMTHLGFLLGKILDRLDAANARRLPRISRWHLPAMGIWIVLVIVFGFLRCST